MRNKFWVLGVFGLCGFLAIAAEKNRDWKMGQVVDSDQSTSALHTIATKDRNYLVKGSIGNDDNALAVGASVRFAVEGKTMFVSLADREYRLYVVGERIGTLKDALAQPPSTPAPASAPAPRVLAPAPARPTVQPPAPPQVQAPFVAPQAQPAVKPVADATELLDNDAIVKMILGGLREDTVVRVIETRPGKYILNPDALTGLKAAGVPSGVVAAMKAKMAPPK